MGLLKAGFGAIDGVLADQWKEYFYCDSIDTTVLMVKGEKRTSKRSSNTKGEDNIISNGAVIAVNDGQCMLIVDQGKVVELCAEPGEFVYESSTEPSIFYGKLGQSIKDTFKTIGKRFTMGGDTGKDQRIYYINTKEIIGNKYGTANPVPFRVVDQNIGLDIDISIRCHGEYSYKITDPILFYTNVCGNVTDDYKRETIDSQLKTELLTALQPAFAKISAMGVRYSALPGHTTEVADALNTILTEKWKELRGLTIASFGINSVTASESDEAMIKELQKTAVLRNPNMAAATLVGAQAEAMKTAAGNTATGPMFAFAGMNMAANAGGMRADQLYAMGMGGQNPVSDQAIPQGSSGQGTTPNVQQQTGWTCSCGAVNKGKFCAECGQPKPAGARQYKCDKCGWEPADPQKAPKFCPECGDPFDGADQQ